MENNFEYQRLNQNNLKDLFFLFRLSNKKIEFKSFCKKYETKTFGNEYLGFLAYDPLKKIPIAFYGVLPVIGLYNGLRMPIAQSADTLTHPDYRKKGMFVTLAKMTYALCKENGVHYLYGIPNYNSFGGFINKLDWKHLGNFHKYQKSLFTVPLNTLSKRNAIVRKTYLLYVQFCLKVLGFSIKKELSNQIVKKQLYIPKNRDYLDYKLSKEHFILSFKDLEIIVSFHRFLKIGYISNLQNPYGKKAIGKLLWVARLSGCHKIVYQCQAQELNFKDLFSRFHLSEGLPYIIKEIGEVKTNEILEIDYLDFDTF